MIKGKHFIIMLGLSIILFCTGSVYAMTSVAVTNEFETGIVDIELTEYQKNGDKEELWVDKTHILPADKISKIPRIRNDGNDCYVRAKITFRGTDEINDGCLFGMSDKWTKADDGYYYYKEILRHGKDVDLFQGVNVPKEFSQEMEGKQFYIDIDVDAIQSKNFKPEFASAAPWGSVEILECEKEGQYDVSTFKKSDSKSFQIVYQGNSGKLIKNQEDFFDNFPYLMPGDVYKDTAKIVNDGNTTIKLYFRSEALDDSPLLDKIKLKITTNIDGKEKTIYIGNLRAKSLSEDIVLGYIKKGEKADFHFEIEVPKELNNKYTILDSYVRWIFSTKPIEDVKPEKDTVKTGDAANIGLYLSLFGICLGTVAVIGLKKVRKEEVEDGE